MLDLASFRGDNESGRGGGAASMFNRTAKGGAKSAPGLSFIGPEMVIKGDVAAAAQLHVEGRIDGNVACESLCQGESGRIAGNIRAKQARIAGTVEGAVDAATLVLDAGASVTGDVTYETISIAAGARIDGRLTRRGAAAADTMIVATSTDSPAPAGPVPAPAPLFEAAKGRKAAAA
jgi:cytoskeletal protein CcmA (bactofilin family)